MGGPPPAPPAGGDTGFLADDDIRARARTAPSKGAFQSWAYDTVRRQLTKKGYDDEYCKAIATATKIFGKKMRGQSTADEHVMCIRLTDGSTPAALTQQVWARERSPPPLPSAPLSALAPTSPRACVGTARRAGPWEALPRALPRP